MGRLIPSPCSQAAAGSGTKKNIETNDMNKKVFPFLARIAVSALLPAVLHGCGKLYKESMDDCYGGVSIILKVDPATTGAAEAEAAANHAVIYVFDKDGQMLERRETEVNKEEMLWYPQHKALSVVGWINKDGKYTVTPFGSGITRADGLVSLNATRADTDCHIPSDLFYGDVEIISETTSRNVIQGVVNASRLVGSMIVTVRGLREYASLFDDNFWITVGPTHSAVDFYGQYRNRQAAHTPVSAFVSSGDHVTSIFNMLPTGVEETTVSIYHKTAGLIYQTAKDRDGRNISVVADRTENVLIDFTAGIEVSVLRSEWGEVHIWGKDII